MSASLLAVPALVGCGQENPSAATGGATGSGAMGGSAPSGGQGGTGGSAMPGTGGSGGSSGSSGTGGSATAGTGGTGAAGGTGGSVGGSAGAALAGAGGVPAMAGSSAVGGAGASAGGTGAGLGGMGMGGDAAGGAGAMSGAGGAGGMSPTGCIDPTDFTGWPSGKGPADVGAKVVGDVKTHTKDTYGGAGYSLAFAWFGALEFTKTTGDTASNMKFITDFEPYATGQTTVDNSASASVDYRTFGTLPLEIYLENGDDRCKTLGLARADAQWAKTTSDGITSDARYWIDDMFMITGLQVWAYRATKDSKYLDRSAKTMQAYIAALQQGDGLFWHTRDSHAYWGRANGWVASGMTELLKELPAGAVRDSIMTAYKKQLDALLPLQISGGNDDGCWRQVVDLSSANAETSCTAMFSYALTAGVRNGWLTDPKYAAAARKGWLAVANKTSSSGKLDRVCPGTGAAPSGSLQSQQQFYASISLGTGDLHGEAPELWLANELLTSDCHGIR